MCRTAVMQRGMPWVVHVKRSDGSSGMVTLVFGFGGSSLPSGTGQRNQMIKCRDE